MTEAQEAFRELAEIIARLRHPENGCPWDLEQTHASLVPCLIEEAYELADAIRFDPHKMKEELGDVLLQVMLQSQIAADRGDFSITDVMRAISAKLIRRHPHDFGGGAAADSAEVVSSWERIKRAEAPGKGLLDGLPRSMPALAKAQRIGARTARVGFDWSDAAGVRAKVEEELAELQHRLDDPAAAPDQRAEELGDLLFTLAQLARKLGLDAEEVLDRACLKFMRRFRQLEERAGPDLARMGLERQQQIWEEVKKNPA